MVSYVVVESAGAREAVGAVVVVVDDYDGGDVVGVDLNSNHKREVSGCMAKMAFVTTEVSRKWDRCQVTEDWWQAGQRCHTLLWNLTLGKERVRRKREKNGSGYCIIIIIIISGVAGS